MRPPGGARVLVEDDWLGVKMNGDCSSERRGVRAVRGAWASGPGRFESVSFRVWFARVSSAVACPGLLRF